MVCCCVNLFCVVSRACVCFVCDLLCSVVCAAAVPVYLCVCLNVCVRVVWDVP